MDLLRKFKVVRCPLDNEVFRIRSFISHVNAKHKMRPKHWIKKVQKEESVLICASSVHHEKPKLELAVRTRRGNDTFMKKHAPHVEGKQIPLSDKTKDAVRKTLDHVHQVDLDASPIPPTPAAAAPVIPPPSPRDAVGVLEHEEEEEQPDEIVDLDKREELRHDVLQSVMTGFSPLFTPTPRSVVHLDDIEPTLYLEEQDPLRVEPEAAQLLNRAYESIYAPGVRYPTLEEQQQHHTPERHHASTSMTIASPPVLKDQSMQIDGPDQQHASTSMTDMMEEERATPAAAAAAAAADMESIPLLTQSIDHIREVNNMKNVMLTQLMQDNIDLLQNKIQSRKRALQVMEELFETHAQTEPMNDDMTLELSRIIHLKNKLIQQILRETATLHPHAYSLLSRN